MTPDPTNPDPSKPETEHRPRPEDNEQLPEQDPGERRVNDPRRDRQPDDKDTDERSRQPGR